MPGVTDILALLDALRVVHGGEDERALLAELAHPDRPAILSFLNAHAVNLCAAAPSVLAAFAGSDALLRDGVGVKAALAVLGRPAGRNMNGTDFIPALLRALPPGRLAVYGTASPWLERGAEWLATATAHTVVDAAHGFHAPSRYLDGARHHRPDVILLAMGMPTQELLAARLKAALDRPALIINGGAIIDFLAGRVTRAPGALRHAGLEWSYRLAQEPRRLFGRYCLGGIVFARTVARLRIAATGATPPAFEER